MAELYTVLDQNEIDGQGKDVQVTAIEGDADWTKVMIHAPQEVPAGNYDFVYSFQTLSDTTAKDFLTRLVGSVALPEIDFHIDKLSGYSQHMYGFNLSWDGGPFSTTIEMARKGTGFELMCEFAEFSLKRRS
jgi:hypothetical protein